MLINNAHKIEKNDVVAFRLVTGEEIIGKVSDVDENSLTLDKPLTLGANQQGVGFMPTTMLGDPEASIKYMRHHIVCYMKVRSDAESAYKEATTGIRIAPASALKNVK